MGYDQQLLKGIRKDELIELVQRQPLIQWPTHLSPFSPPKLPKADILREVLGGEYGYHPESEDADPSRHNIVEPAVLEATVTQTPDTTPDTSTILNHVTSIMGLNPCFTANVIPHTDTKPSHEISTLEESPNNNSANLAFSILHIDNNRPVISLEGSFENNSAPVTLDDSDRLRVDQNSGSSSPVGELSAIQSIFLKPAPQASVFPPSQEPDFTPDKEDELQDSPPLSPSFSCHSLSESEIGVGSSDLKESCQESEEEFDEKPEVASSGTPLSCFGPDDLAILASGLTMTREDLKLHDFILLDNFVHGDSAWSRKIAALDKSKGLSAKQTKDPIRTQIALWAIGVDFVDLIHNKSDWKDRTGVIPITTIQEYLGRAPSWFSRARPAVFMARELGPSSPNPNPEVCAFLDGSAGVDQIKTFSERFVKKQGRLFVLRSHILP